MEPQLTGSLRVVIVLMILISTGSSDSHSGLNFCGTWHHGNGPLSLAIRLSTGCSGIVISANETSLSIDGQITAQCIRSELISLKSFGLESGDSPFCLYWEPNLDQLKLQVKENNFTLCWPTCLQGLCCTYLSDSPSTSPVAHYGIKNGAINNDIITNKVRTAYNFTGESNKCKLCNKVSHGSTKVIKIEDHAHVYSSEVEMKDNFTSTIIKWPTTQGASAESTITVQIPLALKEAAINTNKVVCTVFQNNSFFQDVSALQEGHEEVSVIDNVVEITVANDTIANLSEPVTIGFHHNAIPETYSRKCVSWDTKKDPLQVSWLEYGCETRQQEATHTECLCNHLTYFTVLVQLQPRPVRHLLALTTITSLGCAVSFISCVILIVFICRKSKRSKEQSTPIHMGLAVSLALLNLLFFFTGVLANVGGQNVCVGVGVGLHYALLSSFTWMGIEVFHTFWLICMIFGPSFPSGIVCYLFGFGLPAIPVTILLVVGDIYGTREVMQSDDVSRPFLMCWMKDNNQARLAHYFTNMTVLPILVLSGLVMLFLVYRKIHSRDEWRQNRVAFLSIWGLSCLFGTTWGLTYLDFGYLSEFVLFLSCILNSFQGFLLMLRFYMLDWMRKQADGSVSGSISTGSTRQHMLSAQEKS